MSASLSTQSWQVRAHSVVLPAAGRLPRRPVGRRRVLFLAMIPVIDSIINQINTMYHPSLGSLSLLQAARGAVLIVMLVMAASTVQRRGSVGRTVGWIALTGSICLAVFAANEAILGGKLVFLSIVAYTQIVYWLIIWYVAVVSILDAASGVAVIKGLIIGALITAASVYYGYVSDNFSSIYRRQGVEATFGFFVSGKGIAGMLVAGALLAAYLGHRRRTRSMTFIALLCLGASFLTYARAGMVALGAALAWLSIWSIRTGLKTQSAWALRLVFATLCGAVIVLGTIGTESLVRRWSDLQDERKAGSGRTVLWAAAVENFLAATPQEQLFGHGFQEMRELMYVAVGESIHTHSDLFDMLLVGGLLGLLVLGLTLAGMMVQIRAAPLRTPEAAVAVAILLVRCFQGFFTGQLFLPDTMMYYVLALTSVLACCGANIPRGLQTRRAWPLRSRIGATRASRLAIGAAPMR